MKTALVLTGALMMLGVSALELPYVSDFGKTDRDVSAVVENGCIVSGGTVIQKHCERRRGLDVVNGRIGHAAGNSTNRTMQYISNANSIREFN